MKTLNENTVNIRGILGLAMSEIWNLVDARIAVLAWDNGLSDAWIESMQDTVRWWFFDSLIPPSAMSKRIADAIDSKTPLCDLRKEG